MPSGYTAPVQDGRITTLHDFAMTCVRALGVCVTMREDAWDAPIPEKFEPNTEHSDKALAEAERLLKELPLLTLEECSARAEADFREKLVAHNKRALDREQSRDRYEEMLRHVREWKPLAKIRDLKSFMLDQLESSLRFDCAGYKYDTAPVLLTGERWREEEMAKASRDMAYHQQERAKEIARTEERNQWLADLRASLAE